MAAPAGTVSWPADIAKEGCGAQQHRPDASDERAAGVGGRGCQALPQAMQGSRTWVAPRFSIAFNLLSARAMWIEPQVDVMLVSLTCALAACHWHCRGFCSTCERNTCPVLLSAVLRFGAQIRNIWRPRTSEVKVI